jgi:hypothetical protein
MLSPNIIIHPTRALITLLHQLFFRAGDDERYTVCDWNLSK